MTVIRVPYRGGPWNGQSFSHSESHLERQGKLTWTQDWREDEQRDPRWHVYRLKKTKAGWVNVFLGTVDKLGELPVKQ